MANVGRPKKDGLDKTIKVVVSDEMASMLESTALETGKTRSDLIRELIPIVSSRDYEGLVPHTSMETLQKYSDQCWNTLHTPNCIFEVADLPNKMPAFVVTFSPETVYVKYPTFKLQVFDGKNPHRSTPQKEIELLLKGVSNRSLVCASSVDYLIIGGRMEKMEFPCVNEVTCLGVTLEENISCKNTIVDILEHAGYHVSVCPSYCIRGDRVELLEDKKYFRLLQA